MAVSEKKNLSILDIFMPPTLKKLKGHIALGWSVRPSKNEARFFKFHRWIPHQKITDPYVHVDNLVKIKKVILFLGVIALCKFWH